MSQTRKVTYYFLRDTFFLLLLVILWICFNFNFWIGPDNYNKRGWFRGDIDISLPYTGAGTVPTVPLVLFAFGMPVFFLILNWAFIDKCCCNNWHYNDTADSNEIEFFSGLDIKSILALPATTDSPQSLLSITSAYNACKTSAILYAKQPHHWHNFNDPTTPSSPIIRKTRFAVYQFFVYVICILFCIIVTTALKLMAGRLRPDFLDRCQPDYTNPDLKIGLNGWIGPEYDFICRGDTARIAAGRESFPSGHSSSSMTASVFVSILLYKRFWYRAQRWGVSFIFVPFCIMAVIAGAAVIATSRHYDNRHFPLDIAVGVSIGLACGLLSLLFPYTFTPTYELDGTLIEEQSVEDPREVQPLNDSDSSSTLRPLPSSPQQSFNIESTSTSNSNMV